MNGCFQVCCLRTQVLVGGCSHVLVLQAGVRELHRAGGSDLLQRGQADVSERREVTHFPPRFLAWSLRIQSNVLLVSETFSCLHLEQPHMLFVRKKTERSKKFFTDLMAKEHVPTMINPKPCGHLCCCAITGCEEVSTRSCLWLAHFLQSVVC